MTSEEIGEYASYSFIELVALIKNKDESYKEAEKIAEQGYSDAYQIIQNLQKEIEKLKEEKKCCEAYCSEEIPNLSSVKDGSHLRKLIVFHVDVGTLPPANATAYINQLKEEYKPTLDKLLPGIGVMWMMNRMTGTRVEILNLE